MHHINYGENKPHGWLTNDELEEKHPDFFAAVNRPRPFAEQGKVLRDIRIQARIVMRDMAAAIRMRPLAISEIERGLRSTNWRKLRKLYREAVDELTE